jgi:Leucine-rich repeat (LRR) protein
LKWLNNVSNTEDNAYETPISTYNRKLDLLASASNITRSDVEKERSPPYLEDAVMDLEEETTNSEDTTPTVTPQSTIGSNELNNLQWHMAQLNMSEIEFGDTFKIGNNYKA